MPVAMLAAAFVKQTLGQSATFDLKEAAGQSMVRPNSVEQFFTPARAAQFSVARRL
jgi:hypothetical protein